jgi:hypothetical protein
MNLLDLQEEVFASSSDGVAKIPPAVKGSSASASTEVSDRDINSLVLFKVESDDNLKDESGQVRKNGGDSKSSVTTEPVSARVDKKVQSSELSLDWNEESIQSADVTLMSLESDDAGLSESADVTLTNPEDEEAGLSEPVQTADLTTTTLADGEGMLSSTPSNEGLASMATSFDTLEVTDSSAGGIEAAKVS